MRRFHLTANWSATRLTWPVPHNTRVTRVHDRKQLKLLFHAPFIKMHRWLKFHLKSFTQRPELKDGTAVIVAVITRSFTLIYRPLDR
jgi:hypothetical protein